MMLLRFCVLGVLAGARTVVETVYRITPRNYTGIANLDTGDAAGDAFFGLYEKSAPMVCRHQGGANLLCSNEPLLQIPGFNVYSAYVVEFDDRFGDYGECNPSTKAPHDFRCGHIGLSNKTCWNTNKRHPEWAVDFASLCDPEECLCDVIEEQAVGREYPVFGQRPLPAGFPTAECADLYSVFVGAYNVNNATVIRRWANWTLQDCCSACTAKKCGGYSFLPEEEFVDDDGYVVDERGRCDLHSLAPLNFSDFAVKQGAVTAGRQGHSPVDFVAKASMDLAPRLNGTWYSTPEAGRCDGGKKMGVDCFWREIGQVRSVNASCVNGNMVDAIVAQRHNRCFEDCPSPQDEDSDCWTTCFFETIAGNASATPPLPETPRELIIDAFTKSFALRGGCPEIPPCPEPCHPPCWAVPPGKPCDDDSLTSLLTGSRSHPSPIR